MKETLFENNEINSAVSYLNYLFPQFKFEYRRDGDSISFVAKGDSDEQQVKPPEDNNSHITNRILTITNEEIKESNEHCILVGKDGEGKDFYWNQTASPNLVISGYTGSGKTSLLNTIMRNILIKNDSSVIYLSDIRPRIPENNTIHQIKPGQYELYEVLKKIKHLMLDRTNTLFELGWKIDEHGYIASHDYVLINDRLYKPYDIVKLKHKTTGRQLEIEAKDIYELGDSRDYLIKLIIDRGNHEDEILAEMRVNKVIEVGGIKKSLIEPIYLILDEYTNICCGRIESQLINLIEGIMATNKSTNVYVIISGQNMTRESLTPSMRCNTLDYFLCGDGAIKDKREILKGSILDCFNKKGPGNAVHLDEARNKQSFVRLYYSSQEDLVDALD